MLIKIGERLSIKNRDDCSEEFAVEELVTDGSITVKRSTNEASLWCCTQVSLNDRVDPTLLTMMKLLIILMSLMQALQYPVSRLSLQEVHAGDFPTLLANQPYVYDGPSGSRGRDAGFLIHEGVSCTPIRGVTDSVSVRWRVIQVKVSFSRFMAFLRVIASLIVETSSLRPDMCIPPWVFQ